MKFFIMFFLMTRIVFANDPAPEELINFSHLDYDTAQIKWVRVDNIREACDNMRVSRGKGPYDHNMLACSFWDYASDRVICTIITGKKTSMMTISHEVLHCYLGQFHED